MSEQQPQARLYAFGEWRKQEAPADAEPTPLGRRALHWLQTGEGPVDADMSRVLHQEFQALAGNRENVVQRITAVVQQLKQMADAECEEDYPFSNATQFSVGYKGGRYAGLSNAAQLMQDVLNAAMLEAV